MEPNLRFVYDMRSSHGDIMHDEGRSATATVQKSFPFVSYSGPDVKDPEVQRAIRRHVMVPIAQQRREKNLAREDQRGNHRTGAHRILVSAGSSAALPNPSYSDSLNNEDVQQLEFSIQKPSKVSTMLVQYQSEPWNINGPQPQVSRFSAGFSDPFIRYPVEMTPRLYQLLDRVFDDRVWNMKPYRDAYFPMALMGPAAFHQIISGFIFYLSRLCPVQEREDYEREGLSHQNKAIRLINRRISNPNYVICDSLIGSVIGFVCQSHINQDYETCYMHMDWLSKIIAMKGGIEATNKCMRMGLGWLDINVSITQDQKPRWPLAAEFAQKPFPPDVEPSHEVLQLSKNLQILYPAKETNKLSKIFQTLDKLFQHLTNEVTRTSGQIYRDHAFVGSYINPLVHALLSMQSPVIIDDAGLSILQACRLAIILSVTEIRRLFGIVTVSSVVQTKKLYRLPTSSVNWSELEQLHLWILSMAIIETETKMERIWFMKEWTTVLHTLGYHNYEAAERSLQSLPWISEIHGVKLRAALSIYSLSGNNQLRDLWELHEPQSFVDVLHT